MVNWQSSLWRRWIGNVSEFALGRRRSRRRGGGRRRRLVVELLERRLVPALVSIDGVVARDDAISVDSNTSVAVDVLANDLDPNRVLDPSTLLVSSGPAHGTADVQPNELGSLVVVYSPELNFKGTDVFTYQVQDSGGGVAHEATVTVTV